MRTEKEKKVVDLTIFRAVFALEDGGGQIDVTAENEQGAWVALRKIDPKAFLKVKSFKEIGYC